MFMDSSSIPTLHVLPREILRNVFRNYCDCHSLDNIWKALSCNRRLADNFWILLNEVLDARMAGLALPENGVDTIAARPLPWDLPTSHRNRVFHQRTKILNYCENYLGVLWCGNMEFMDPLLTDGRIQTAKVIVRCDPGYWNWDYVVAWNRSFPCAIKLVSQIYNFVPIRPRGQVYGFSLQDQAILEDVSQRLQARDLVMTMRFSNSQGFILRIITPSQARHRLERFGWNSMADLESAASALICSWECPVLSDEIGDSISITDKCEAMYRIVHALDDS